MDEIDSVNFNADGTALGISEARMLITGTMPAFIKIFSSDVERIAIFVLFIKDTQD